MPRYGIATLLENHPVGYEFTPDNIPLHLTHVDSFEVDLGVDELAKKLGQALSDQQAIKVKAVADTHLGPHKDIPVTMLERTPELMELHKTIMDVLESEGAVIKRPEYHRESFNPHVSVYGDRRIMVGQDVHIKDISIGVKTGEDSDAIHRIVATIDL